MPIFSSLSLYRARRLLSEWWAWLGRLAFFWSLYRIRAMNTRLLRNLNMIRFPKRTFAMATMHENTHRSLFTLSLSFSRSFYLSGQQTFFNQCSCSLSIVVGDVVLVFCGGICLSFVPTSLLPSLSHSVDRLHLCTFISLGIFCVAVFFVKFRGCLSIPKCRQTLDWIDRALSLSELRKTKQRATACNRNDKKKKNTEKQQQQQRKRFAIKTETKSIWHRLFIACLSLSVSLPGYPLPHRLMFLKRCTDSFAFSRGF